MSPHTNVSSRRVLLTDPLYAVVKSAVDTLILQGEAVCITAQNLVEFQALATRPLTATGLGLTPIEANERAGDIEALFPLLPEVPEIYSYWRTLMETIDVRGRQVYDARLVAVRLAHGITHILTFNGSHFRRFPGITVVDPGNISAIQLRRMTVRLCRIDPDHLAILQVLILLRIPHQIPYPIDWHSRTSSLFTATVLERRRLSLDRFHAAPDVSVGIVVGMILRLGHPSIDTIFLNYFPEASILWRV